MYIHGLVEGALAVIVLEIVALAVFAVKARKK